MVTFHFPFWVWKLSIFPRPESTRACFWDPKNLRKITKKWIFSIPQNGKLPQVKWKVSIAKMVNDHSHNGFRETGKQTCRFGGGNYGNLEQPQVKFGFPICSIQISDSQIENHIFEMGNSDFQNVTFNLKIGNLDTKNGNLPFFSHFFRNFGTKSLFVAR